MNYIYWLIMGVFIGWITTCLAICISDIDIRPVMRFLLRLEKRPISQHQNQDLQKGNTNLELKGHQKRCK
jgi:hypothetical protein